ncbi:hypothetical protein C8Q75DRAFT_889906 [Abortiporus biennis]|nr:hypothetical protein C8Q75DRAFT_889906 [Abortiporus biennis]
MSQYVEVVDANQSLIDHARQKFPEEYERIVKKHGMAEFLLDEDGRTLIGLAEPVDILEASEHRELQRFKAGHHDSRTIERPLTSNGLIQVAAGQLAYTMAIWESIRTDPMFLYTLVVQRAKLSIDLYSDIKGSDPNLTPEDYLKRSRYVGMQVRFIVHNTALRVADWSVILEYFKDIKKLDDTFGRFGNLEKRKELMSQVKELIDQIQINNIDKRHEDYSGAMLDRDYNRYPNFATVYHEQTLQGALARLLVGMSGDPDAPVNAHLLEGLSTAFYDAPVSEREKLGPDFLDAWGELEQITDIIVLLGTDGEVPWEIKSDERYRTHAQNAKQSEKIINDSFIDKPIRNVESLKSESVLKKIWAEFDKTAMKKMKKPLEKVLAFAPVVPTWTHKPATVRRPSRPTGPIAEAEDLQPEPTSAPRNRVKRVVVSESAEGNRMIATSKDPEDSPIPDIPRSRPVPTYVVPNIPEATLEPVTRRPPREKRRGVPQPPPLPTSASQPTEIVPEQGRTIYRLGKREYDAMTRLLKEPNPMSWVEFERVMAALEYSIIPLNGSAVKFIPPEWAETSPFFVHRPHESEIPTHLVRNLGSRLKKQYGWNLDWFSDETPGAESSSEEN